MISMTSNKPYLIRAIYDWICDNECTPYLYLDTTCKGLILPPHLLNDNPVALNISPSACQSLLINADDITFQARFSGQVFDIHCPMPAVIAILARETGQGLNFLLQEQVEEEGEPDPPDKNDQTENVSDQSSPSPSVSKLKLIK
ncbi:MAG: ClpXP protease specificity-enhancing factor [Gammaproteobacteria bacterium]|nr:MAG: ClpXP protease specificity-enhancing factor [Gammaproteobacteria bacterium]